MIPDFIVHLNTWHKATLSPQSALGSSFSTSHLLVCFSLYVYHVAAYLLLPLVFILSLMPYCFQGDLKHKYLHHIFTAYSVPTGCNPKSQRHHSKPPDPANFSTITSLQSLLDPTIQSPIQTYSHIPSDSSPNASALPLFSWDTILLLTLIPFHLASTTSSFKISLNCCLFYGALMLATCLLLPTLCLVHFPS